MTEEKLPCRKTRGKPLIVLLQKRDYARQRSVENSPVMSPMAPGCWEAVGERRPSSSSDWSSSYTSMTRPLTGRNSDSSCELRTSILDQEEEEEEREGRSLLRLVCRRRDSSADTSRDIDDIEDLELDGEAEEDNCDSGDCEEETDRRSGTVPSPDLAYCSMEGRVLSPELPAPHHLPN